MDISFISVKQECVSSESIENASNDYSSVVVFISCPRYLRKL